MYFILTEPTHGILKKRRRKRKKKKSLALMTMSKKIQRTMLRVSCPVLINRNC